MKKNLRIVMYVLLSIALLCPIILYLMYHHFEKKYYAALIPPPIEVDHELLIDGKGSQESGCGVASYLLTDDTMKAIMSKGIDYFAGVTSATRLHFMKESTPQDVVAYSYWQKTPVPESYFVNGTMPGIKCATSLRNDVVKRIQAAAKGEHGYYTTDGEHMRILILPELRMVMLVYNYNE